MKKNSKKIISIIVIILLILSIVFVLKNITIENANKEAEKYQDYTPQEEISDEQLRQTKVVLYFENSETKELESEMRIVDANTLIKNPYNELVTLLIKGPQSSSLTRLIPEGTTLNEITLEGSCAVINVSTEILNCESDEIKLRMVNSIVNTLTNLKEVDSVRFLVNGETNEKLQDTYMKNQ